MATFQKDGLWVQGGQGQLSNVSEETPFVAGQLGRVMSIRSNSGATGQADYKVPRFYQYVQNSTTATQAPVSGQAAYWCDLDDFIVTGDTAYAIGYTTNSAFLQAGVWLGTYPAAGKYGFIQVGGPSVVVVCSTNTGRAGEAVIAYGSQFSTVGAVVTNETTNPGLATYGIRRVGWLAEDIVATDATGTADIILDVFRHGW